MKVAGLVSDSVMALALLAKPKIAFCTLVDVENWSNAATSQ